MVSYDLQDKYNISNIKKILEQRIYLEKKKTHLIYLADNLKPTSGDARANLSAKIRQDVGVFF